MKKALLPLETLIKMAILFDDDDDDDDIDWRIEQEGWERNRKKKEN